MPRSTPIGLPQEEVMAGKRTTRHDPASHLHAASARWGGTSYKNAPTKSVSVGGMRFVYRELGIDTGVPVIFLNHLAANLDNWDPRVVDGIAAKHRVITFDNRGVGGSGGKTPDTVEAMAQDAVAFIRALGFNQVDLLGFSLGGFVSQVIAEQEPALVRKIILAGTGPAGGEGIVNVTKLTYLDTFHAYATFKDPKELLFFTRTAHGKSQARAFIKRLKERTNDRGKAMVIGAFRTQLKAIHAWVLRSRPTCHASNSPSWWPTAMPIAWCPPVTPTTWIDASPTPHCGSIPTQDTAASSRHMSGSFPRHLHSWDRRFHDFARRAHLNKPIHERLRA
jgi:pimeloyl-ACP methyl ester carboxylesterase